MTTSAIRVALAFNRADRKSPSDTHTLLVRERSRHSAAVLDDPSSRSTDVSVSNGHRVRPGEQQERLDEPLHAVRSPGEFRWSCGGLFRRPLAGKSQLRMRVDHEDVEAGEASAVKQTCCWNVASDERTCRSRRPRAPARFFTRDVDAMRQIGRPDLPRQAAAVLPISREPPSRTPAIRPPTPAAARRDPSRRSKGNAQRHLFVPDRPAREQRVDPP